jgi:hypothetical protein
MAAVMPPNDRSRPNGKSGAAPSDLGLADLNTSYAVDGLQTAIDNAASDWWWSGANLAIAQLARSGRGFDVDAVLDLVGQPEHPAYVGAAFAAAQRRGVIETVGARVGRGGRLRRVWWGVAS